MLDNLKRFGFFSACAFVAILWGCGTGQDSRTGQDDQDQTTTLGQLKQRLRQTTDTNACVKECNEQAPPGASNEVQPQRTPTGPEGETEAVDSPPPNAETSASPNAVPLDDVGFNCEDFCAAVHSGGNPE